MNLPTHLKAPVRKFLFRVDFCTSINQVVSLFSLLILSCMSVFWEGKAKRLFVQHAGKCLVLHPALVVVIGGGQETILLACY